MTEVQQKLIRVLNELMHYYFDLRMEDISIEILQGKTESSIIMSGYPSIVDREELKELSKKLNKPRQEELEEYYWNLVGTVDSSEQMNLVSMLIDSANVELDNGKLTIQVYRKH